jgi:quercetin dioxygenase-like cupin family protein
MPKSKYGKYIVSELQLPESKQKIAEFYSTYATRILWMDDNVVEGAFHMNTSWFLKASTTTENEPHTHDSDEIIGFFGSNADDPYDLGGEIEIWLEDEKHILTRSSLLFIPAGMKHCPLIIRRVDRPIFHFTVVTGGQYTRKLKSPK